MTADPGSIGARPPRTKLVAGLRVAGGATRTCAAAGILLAAPLSAQRSALPAPPATPSVSARVVNGVWFDGTAFRPDTVWIADGVIRLEPQPFDTTLDLGGGFVVPAAGDAHQHRFGTAESLRDDGRRFLDDGIFYVMVQDLISLSPPAELATPGAAWPDVVWTRMPIVDPASGIASYFATLAARGELPGLPPGTSPGGRAFAAVRTAADLDGRWDRIVAANPAFLKVILAFSDDRARRLRDARYTSDPALGFARPGLDPALLPALVARARRAGLRVSAHVETAEDFRVAVAAGVDLIAHLPGWHVGPTAGFADPSLDRWLISDADAAAAARAGIPVITTTWPKAFFDYQAHGAAFRRVQASNLRRLARAGVPLAIGTDGEGTALDEAQQLRSLGLDNLTVLRALVHTTPRAIFPDRRIGCLDEGCEASFLVLRHDPLVDLASLRATRMRVRRGAVLPGVDSVSFAAVTRVGRVTLLRANQSPLFDNVVLFDGPDGALLVDAAYESTGDSLRAAVRRIAGAEPALVVNTHFHHAGGNRAFPTARVVAHEAAAVRMRRGSRMYGVMPIGPWPESALPDTTIGARWRLDLNGEPVELIHLPHAHTDGDLVVVFPRSGVVATGDVFAPLLNPCDIANGCRWSAYLAGIERLLTLVGPDAVVFPGHGPASTRAEIEEFAALLRDVTVRVGARIAEGWTRERLVAEGLPARYAAWGTRGIDADFFLGNAYDAITADRAQGR